ncbi:MAG: D-alanyl-D-alanine carboxypeptidase/D-alanyl-D-alanine-endopeptidase, partial [Bacteroidota bacterium]
EALEKALKTLEEDPVLASGFISFSLRSTKTGEEILQHQGQKSLNVASNMKLVTTASALNILGENYQFKTYLQHDGKIEAGVLKGNLYIKGTGDPTLGSYRMKTTPSFDQLLAQWAAQLRQKEINIIEGNIIADTEAWNNNALPSGWVWGDIGNYYGAAAQALNIADNTYQLYLQPAARIGGEVKVLKTVPTIPDVHFVNRLTTAAAGTGDRAYIDGAPYSNLRFLHGTIPQGGNFVIKGAIPDPAYLIVQKLSKQLQQQGISVKGKALTSLQLLQTKQKLSKERTTLYTHQSPSLSTIIQWVNQYSVNLYAEALYKAIGQALTTEQPTEAIKKHWQLKGLRWKGLQMRDGSGLSPSNGVPTSQMTQMLHLMTKEKHFSTFYDSLPVAGRSGTMASVGGGTLLMNNLRAKTGWMTGVVAFSGYFKTATGEQMCFSISANRFDANYSTMKKKMEKVFLAMIKV